MMHPRVPAVVMSARASVPERKAAHEAGAVGFLSKPFTAQEFSDIVDRLLAGGTPSART
jgi:FixJ family two-component response regulator